MVQNAVMVHIAVMVYAAVMVLNAVIVRNAVMVHDIVMAHNAAMVHNAVMVHSAVMVRNAVTVHNVAVWYITHRQNIPHTLPHLPSRLYIVGGGNNTSGCMDMASLELAPLASIATTLPPV